MICTYAPIPLDLAATRMEQVAVGRCVYYVVPTAMLSPQGGNSTLRYRWPARIEQVFDDAPDGRLALLVITSSGMIRAAAPYDAAQGIWTWHLADDPPVARTPDAEPLMAVIEPDATEIAAMDALLTMPASTYRPDLRLTWMSDRTPETGE